MKIFSPSKAVWLLLLVAGCAAIRVEKVDRPRLLEAWRDSAVTCDHLSPRTVQTLRQLDLIDYIPDRLAEAAALLHNAAVREARPAYLFSLSEINYLRGRQAEGTSPADAAVFYYLSAGYAYHFLFDAPPKPPSGIQQVGGTEDKAGLPSITFDPRFRLACDLYNAGLARCIALAQKAGQLDPSRRLVLPTRDGKGNINLAVRHTGFAYKPEEFGPFLLAGNYDVKGLTNHHRTYGLGVPLIGSRSADVPVPHRFHPTKANFPVTAFFRFRGNLIDLAERRAGWLELVNPLEVQSVKVKGRAVPLETDLTTPLAYFLAQARLDSAGYKGFLRPEWLKAQYGLHSLEPYQRGKIPVVLVHGLFGTPLTWAPLYNDLLADPVLRKRYQFWVYFYPTGAPYLVTASGLRDDLTQLRQQVDPAKTDTALEDMVLIGHSMGGLVSRLCTVDGGDDFWKLVSSSPLEKLDLQPITRTTLRNTFYFKRQPLVTRAIFMGTPHRGSRLSPSLIGRVGSRLAGLPSDLMETVKDVAAENPQLAEHPLPNSVDLLAPDSPALQLIAHRPRPAEVHYHSVIGVSPRSKLFLSRLFGGGYCQASDGVVAYASAHLDDVDSEVVVAADHYGVHQHPLAILEVRRVLLDHLRQHDEHNNPVRRADGR